MQKATPLETGRQLVRSMAEHCDPNYVTYYSSGRGHDVPDVKIEVHEADGVLFGTKVRDFLTWKPFGSRVRRVNETEWWSSKFGIHINIDKESREALGIARTSELVRMLPIMLDAYDFEPVNRRKPYQVTRENAVPSFPMIARDAHTQCIELRHYYLSSEFSFDLIKRSVAEESFEESEREFNEHKTPYMMPRVSYFVLTDKQLFEFPFAGDAIHHYKSGYKSIIWQDSHMPFRFIDINSDVAGRITNENLPINIPYEFGSIDQLEEHLKSSPIQTALNKAVISHAPRIERLINFYKNLADPFYKI